MASPHFPPVRHGAVDPAGSASVARGRRKIRAGFAGPALAAVLVVVFGGGPGAVQDATAASSIEEGRKIAFDRRKGNCIACHVMAGATLPGNVGPPLVGMTARFPDKARLRVQIWDATKINPQSLMPPFGRHEILTEDEIDKVVEYVHTL